MKDTRKNIKNARRNRMGEEQKRKPNVRQIEEKRIR